MDATTGGLALWVSFKVIATQVSQIVRGTVATNGTGQTTITWIRPRSSGRLRSP